METIWTIILETLWNIFLLLVPYYAVTLVACTWLMYGIVTLTEFGAVSGTVWGQRISAPAAVARLRSGAIVKIIVSSILILGNYIALFPLHFRIDELLDRNSAIFGHPGFMVFVGMSLLHVGAWFAGYFLSRKRTQQSMQVLCRADHVRAALEPLSVMAALDRWVPHAHKIRLYRDGFGFYNAMGGSIGGIDFARFQIGDLYSEEEIQLVRLYILQKYPDLVYEHTTRNERTGPNTVTVHHYHIFTRK